MSQKYVIPKYFSSTAENKSKHLKIDENSMKDFEDESKDDEARPGTSQKKVNCGTFFLFNKLKYTLLHCF